MKKFLLFVGGVIVLSWLVKGLIFSIYHVPTNSMVPVIEKDSYVLVLKYVYNVRSPEYWPLTNNKFPIFSFIGTSQIRKGDIVLFDDPLAPIMDHSGEKDDLLKRCVAFPGDTLYQKLVLNEKNGELRVEYKPWNTKHLEPDNNVRMWVIPGDSTNGGCFVLGDNYNHSFDSRYFGVVPEKLLIGKAVLKIWPWPPKVIS
ncbi:signal peptidase I [Gracilimonas mengyeensis]|uniref:Signal peptidase I n=1 Tax=Gracilimonas mengyeensis TaxID=1302730 RepID=A0A521E1T6_9BACT|nr:signal peptidase I [Gracilimonas mengyeensis]SMO77916.1 signal peptidase I [Gracilimonas mengyeensis]